MVNIVPITIINDYCISTTIVTTIIATMVTIIMIGTINTNSYTGSKCKIRWIISIIIRRIIGYIGW